MAILSFLNKQEFEMQQGLINHNNASHMPLLLPMFPELLTAHWPVGHTVDLTTGEANYSFVVHVPQQMADGRLYRPTVGMYLEHLGLKAVRDGESYIRKSAEADFEEAAATLINIINVYEKAINGAETLAKEAPEGRWLEIGDNYKVHISDDGPDNLATITWFSPFRKAGQWTVDIRMGQYHDFIEHHFMKLRLRLELFEHALKDTHFSTSGTSFYR